MKSVLVSILSITLSVGVAVAQEAPESLEGRASYGIGLNFGRTLQAQGVNVDLDLVVRGVKDALTGADLLVAEEDINSALAEFQAQLQQQQQARIQEMASKNKAAGAAFLAENRGKENVVTLPSGLQYQVLKAGDGASPSATDTVRAHYEGRLIDGQVFDSSYQRGEAAEFNLSRVIKGWTEAVPMMKTGGKWRLWIPSDLAYGPSGRPPVIEPNSALVFDVELLGLVAEAAE